ncbi:MAG: hypothetical protein MK193_07720 [Lentisphaeria bacterium]|nr:hypothetical protein [Lentisphaeria bacterium]
MATSIHFDKTFKFFEITRNNLLGDFEDLDLIIWNAATKLPTYVTIKDVSYRWGYEHKDIYPVSQVEKLWSDMSSLYEIGSDFMLVTREEGSS